MTQIDDKHAALLADGTLDLGSPVGTEEQLFDGGSARSYQRGRIYFHPRVGQAFELHGEILSAYLAAGAEKSGLGYPISDEGDDPFVLLGRMNELEQGRLRFGPGSPVTLEPAALVRMSQVTVKIEDGIFIPLGPGGQMSLSRFATSVVGPGFEGVIALLGSLLGDIRFRRVFDSRSGDEIQILVDEARAATPGYEPPNFNNFLELHCPPGFDTGPLVDALSQLSGVVEYAYPTPVASDPAVLGTSNRLFVQQAYLRPGTDGIGVQAAWAKGADGSGTRFIDLERGWFGHEDLPPGLRMIGGHIRRGSAFHGTAVLGEVLAVDNGIGVCGIAPATSARLISYHFPGFAFNSRESRQALADAVLTAQAALSFGDVLLLEAQLEARVNGVDSRVPVETDPAVFAAIQLATSRGVTVVEPAGNSPVDLDQFVDLRGRRVLNPQDPEFQRSGAIVVGSGQSPSPHPRIVASTPSIGALPGGFGSRVDVYAWGENVVTCGGPGDSPRPTAYWTNPPFGGTSAASAIIAGVCLLVQDLFQRLNPATGAPGKVSAARMRSVLTRPVNSTPGAPGARIGVMPDLKKLIANEFV